MKPTTRVMLFAMVPVVALLLLAGVRELARARTFQLFGALVAGFGTIAGVYIPVFALVLVVCGLALIVGVLSKGRAAR
jgi:hypothetical protein